LGCAGVPVGRRPIPPGWRDSRIARSGVPREARTRRVSVCSAENPTQAADGNTKGTRSERTRRCDGDYWDSGTYVRQDINELALAFVAPL
jgi:hypothetical protein